VDARARIRSALGLTRFPRFLAVWQTSATFVLVTVAWAFARRPDHPLERMEARYGDLARRTGVPIAGGYDPALTGTTGSDFFDESHLRPAALVRLVAGLPAQ
jgi:hypothetical protein